MRLLVGLDDTDAGDSIGTGALAREIACFLARDFGAPTAGITRHQLFVHPDIPYTSHNSAACLEVDWSRTAQELYAACSILMGHLFHPGADPGLCVALFERAAAPALPDFGRRAQREVVGKAEALQLAERHGLLLTELGGSGLGVIGALAACGLRASGEDGRFLAFPGARQISGSMRVRELMAKTPVDRVVDDHGRALQSDDMIDTRAWVRPELRGGKAVLVVERDHETGGYAVARRKGGDQDM